MAAVKVVQSLNYYLQTFVFCLRPEHLLSYLFIDIAKVATGTYKEVLSGACR